MCCWRPHETRSLLLPITPLRTRAALAEALRKVTKAQVRAVIFTYVISPGAQSVRRSSVTCSSMFPIKMVVLVGSDSGPGNTRCFDFCLSCDYLSRNSVALLLDSRRHTNCTTSAVFTLHFHNCLVAFCLISKPDKSITFRCVCAGPPWHPHFYSLSQRN
eukprot:20030_4